MVTVLKPVSPCGVEATKPSVVDPGTFVKAELSRLSVASSVVAPPGLVMRARKMSSTDWLGNSFVMKL